MGFKKTPEGWLITNSRFEAEDGLKYPCNYCKFINKGTCKDCLDNNIEPDKTEPQQVVVLSGWICPGCGAGNSPFANRCGCVPLPLIVTC